MTESGTKQEKRLTARKEQETRSSSTTTIAHDPGHVLNPVDMEAIRTAYVDVLGPMNFYKAKDLEWAIKWGLEAGAILDAIEQTAFAAKPSHVYLRAILERYVRFKILTREDAERDREQFRMLRQNANRERAAWYKDPADDMPW